MAMFHAEAGNKAEAGGKYSAAEMERQKQVINELRAEFPDANIRRDEEHFIYERKIPGGKTVTVHTPLWEKIPVKVSDKS
jgi:hypothetical protein